MVWFPIGKFDVAGLIPSQGNIWHLSHGMSH